MRSLPALMCSSQVPFIDRVAATTTLARTPCPPRRACRRRWIAGVASVRQAALLGGEVRADEGRAGWTGQSPSATSTTSTRPSRSVACPSTRTQSTGDHGRGDLDCRRLVCRGTELHQGTGRNRHQPVRVDRGGGGAVGGIVRQALEPGRPRCAAGRRLLVARERPVETNRDHAAVPPSGSSAVPETTIAPLSVSAVSIVTVGTAYAARPKKRAMAWVEQMSASRMKGSPSWPQASSAASGSMGVAWPDLREGVALDLDAPLGFRKRCRTTGPRSSSSSAMASMPCTSVHCSTSSRAFGGSTVPSASPCQIETRGQGPAKPEAGADPVPPVLRRPVRGRLVGLERQRNAAVGLRGGGPGAAAIGQPGDDRARGEDVRVGGEHDRRHAAAGRAVDEDSRRIDFDGGARLCGHLPDRQRLTAVARRVANFGEVKALR